MQQVTSSRLSPTERRNPRSVGLDKMPVRAAIKLMLSEEAKVPGRLLKHSKEIAKAIDSYKIIVTKSTVPVGTNAELARRMGRVTDVPFDVASNPEFTRELQISLPLLVVPRQLVLIQRPARAGRRSRDEGVLDARQPGKGARVDEAVGEVGALQHRRDPALGRGGLLSADRRPRGRTKKDPGG